MGGSRLGRRAASIDLPAPGGPTIKHVMAAGRRDFECAARAALADHVGHVRNGGGCGLAEVGRGDGREPGVGRSGQMRAQ